MTRFAIPSDMVFCTRQQAWYQTCVRWYRVYTIWYTLCRVVSPITVQNRLCRQFFFSFFFQNDVPECCQPHCGDDTLSPQLVSISQFCLYMHKRMRLDGTYQHFQNRFYGNLKDKFSHALFNQLCEDKGLTILFLLSSMLSCSYSDMAICILSPSSIHCELGFWWRSNSTLWK